MVRWLAQRVGREGGQSDRLPASARRVVARLPVEWTGPIGIEFRPRLSSYGQRLESGTGRGDEVHGGTDLRRRLIYLDDSLLRKPGELRRILVHELFHFAWVRLGNTRRIEFERLLAGELRCGARGELGWSAEMRKRELERSEIRRRTIAWRGYVCESFCDTAAWIYSGLERHDEFTLAHPHRRARHEWFQRTGEQGFRV